MRNKTYILAVVFLITINSALAGDLSACKAQNANSYVPCKKLADSGSPDGMFGLGMLFLEGNGVKRNYDESFKLMHKAAMLGHAPAQLQVGQAYVNGQGVRQDFEEGYAWFLVAKENGNEMAQQGIDFMNQKGLISRGRINAVTQKANNLYAKTKNKQGFQFDQTEGSQQVNGLQEYCNMVMPTVDSVILLKKYGKPRSDAHQLMIGMTDQRAIKMMEGVINWVWSSKIPFSKMHNDFLSKCIKQSSEVSFIFQ